MSKKKGIMKGCIRADANGNKVCASRKVCCLITLGESIVY